MIISIYKITNSVTNKVYIGHTTRQAEVRFDEHIRIAHSANTNYKISNAIRKYGDSNFTCEVIYQSKDLSHIREMEDHFINEHDSLTNGYNSAKGGQGGCIVLYKENPAYEEICNKLSIAQKKNSEILREKAKRQHKENNFGTPYKDIREETRRKLSAVRKGKKNTKEHIEKQKKSLRKTLSDPSYIHPNKNRAKSLEERIKISENHADVSGPNNPMYGKKHEEKTKELLRQKAMNRKRIDCEYCNKSIDASNYYRWHGNSCKSKKNI